MERDLMADAAASPADFAPSLHGGDAATYRQPLSVQMRIGLVALVVFFHVGGAWALMQIRPPKLEVGDIASMEVRMVSAEQLTPPMPDLQTPPPEDTPPPELQPQLESMIQPPLPDLPPPTFPVETPPPRPKPPPPKLKPAPPPAVPTTA